MTAQSQAHTRSRRTLRIAVTAAALGVIGCFSAAFTCAGNTAQAGEQPDTPIAAAR